MATTGAILVGGRSLRMGGRAKGLLKIDGEPLVVRLARILQVVCDQVLLVGDPYGPYADLGWRIVPDVRRSKGAPGGVHAALTYSEPGWTFVTACDLPRLDRVTIEDLAKVRGHHDVVVYRAGGRLQPLAAWWQTRSRDLFVDLLKDNPSLTEILATLDVLEVEAPDEQVFTNVNTREEADALQLSPMNGVG